MGPTGEKYLTQLLPQLPAGFSLRITTPSGIVIM